MTIKMCELCQNADKVKSANIEEPTQNQCFEVRSYFEDYKPFKKDKKTIVRLMCKNFSHIQTAVLGLRGGGRIVLRATPEKPQVNLSDDLGPLFNQPPK